MSDSSFHPATVNGKLVYSKVTGGLPELRTDNVGRIYKVTTMEVWEVDPAMQNLTLPDLRNQTLSGPDVKPIKKPSYETRMPVGDYRTNGVNEDELIQAKANLGPESIETNSDKLADAITGNTSSTLAPGGILDSTITHRMDFEPYLMPSAILIGAILIVIALFRRPNPPAPTAPAMSFVPGSGPGPNDLGSFTRPINVPSSPNPLSPNR